MHSSNELKKVIISEPTLQRIPVYLQMLKRLYDREGVFVSSSQIAGILDLKPIQVRKDLEAAGAKGRPKLGYAAKELINTLEEFLGYNNTSEAFLAGCGNLGSALLGFKGFESLGISIAAAFDTNMNIVGSSVHGHKVLNMEKFSGLAERMKISIGIITVPAEQAQATADMMCACGLRAIWNFAPIHLKVPEGIIVKNEDIAASLAVLVKKLDVETNKV